MGGSKKKSRHKRKHDGTDTGDSDSASEPHYQKKKRNDSDSTGGSDSSNFSCDKKKNKRKEKKEKKKLKKLKKKLKKLEKQRSSSTSESGVFSPPAVTSPIETDKKVMVPMTKEQWEKQQQEVRREYDPSTGRTRLIRGSGEIIEEIVSRDKQKEINKQATAGDGIYYQKQTGLL